LPTRVTRVVSVVPGYIVVPATGAAFIRTHLRAERQGGESVRPSRLLIVRKMWSWTRWDSGSIDITVYQ